MLVDSHCHLDFPELIADIDGVLERANAAGVVEMLAICTRLDRFPGILKLAATDDRLWCSVGVHPHEADDAGVESPEVLLRTDGSTALIRKRQTLDQILENEILP